MNNSANNILGKTENDCFGCSACVQECPCKCISMKMNKRGFLIPSVDETNCIHCSVCLNVCPEVKKLPMFGVKKAYAVVTQDRSVLQRSTSGGVFGILAKEIISQGGVVCGCIWKEDFTVKHVFVDNENDLSLVQQSKYLQSDIGNTYREAREYLQNKRVVLFSGTACQIAGLRNFLKREYTGLLTIEVACHGVPSPGLFTKYITWKEKNYGNKIVGFSFRNRDKHRGGEHYKLRIDFENGAKKYILASEDPYYGSFLEGRTLRETCYHCKYKQSERVADLCLSDFWGIEKELKHFPARFGASAVLLNTEKAVSFFQKVSNEFVYELCSFDSVIRHNKSIISSSYCDEDYKLKTIMNDSELLFLELKPQIRLKNRIKSMIPDKLKYILKRI